MKSGENPQGENSGTLPFNHMTGVEAYQVYNEDFSRYGLGTNKVKGFIDFDLMKERGANVNLSYDINGKAYYRNP